MYGCCLSSAFPHVFAQTGKYCAGLLHILLRLFRSLSAFFLLTLTSYVANQFGSLDHHRSRLGGKKRVNDQRVVAVFIRDPDHKFTYNASFRGRQCL